MAQPLGVCPQRLEDLAGAARHYRDAARERRLRAQTPSQLAGTASGKPAAACSTAAASGSAAACSTAAGSAPCDTTSCSGRRQQ
eukprot:5743440-Amphidinium_carterae.1